MRKNIFVIVFICIFINNVYGAKDVIGARKNVQEDEVVWFDTTENSIIAVWADGTVGGWDFDGHYLSSFQIPNYSVNGSMLKLAQDKKPYFVHAFENRISIYNPENWSIVKDVNTSESISNFVFVPVADGGKLAFANAFGKIKCIDIKTDKREWEATVDDVYGNVLILPEQGIYILSSELGIVAKDTKGNELWKKEIPQDHYSEIYFDYLNEQKAVFFSADFNSDNDKYTAINLSTGSTLWTENSYEYWALRAVSEDYKKQVWQDSNDINIVLLPSKKAIKVEGISEPIDAVFAPEGKGVLVILPQFKVLAETKESYTLGRKSAEIKVVDVNTGKTIKKFQLKKTDKTQLGIKKSILKK